MMKFIEKERIIVISLNEIRAKLHFSSKFLVGKTQKLEMKILSNEKN